MLKPRTYVQYYQKTASVDLSFVQYKENILEEYSNNPFITIKSNSETELELTFYVDYQHGQILKANAKIVEDSFFFGYDATTISLNFRRELILHGHAEILFLGRACIIYWIVSLLLIGCIIDGSLVLRFGCVGLPLLGCLFLLVFSDIFYDGYSEFESSKLHAKLRGIFSSLLSVTSDARPVPRYYVWD